MEAPCEPKGGGVYILSEHAKQYATLEKDFQFPSYDLKLPEALKGKAIAAVDYSSGKPEVTLDSYSQR